MIIDVDSVSEISCVVTFMMTGVLPVLYVVPAVLPGTAQRRPYLGPRAHHTCWSLPISGQRSGQR